MKHLLVSFHSCPFEPPGTGFSGGMNTFLSGLLPALFTLQGIRTDVITRGFGETIDVTYPAPGVRAIHLPCGWVDRDPTRGGALRALPRFVSSARLWLGKDAGAYDAVSAHYWMSGVAARAIFGGREGSHPSPPMAFSFHTVEARKVRTAVADPDELAKARMAAERSLAGSVDALVCLSRYDLVETVKCLPAAAGPRGAVIPPGIDARFRVGPSREEARETLGLARPGTLFLLASRADSGKNAVAAIDAVRRLRASGWKDVALAVAGQGRPAGEAPCQEVAYLGPVRHEDMPAYYAAADAVVCPSLYESFGLVPLESLAVGTPVVVPRTVYWGSRVGSEGGGLAYDPSDPAALETALRLLVSDPSLRARLSGESRRLAAPFTWARCAASWASLLSRLASPGGRPGTPRAPGARRRR